MWDKVKGILNPGKGGVVLGFSTFVGSIISAIFGVIVAPILGAEDYGIVSYFFAIAGLTTAITSFGAHESLLVYLSKGIKIFSTFSFITIIPSFIAAIVIFLIFNEISISVLIIGMIIFELVLSKLLAKQLYVQHLKYSLTQKFLFIGLSLTLYYVMGPQGYILGLGLSMFPGVLQIFKGFKESKIDVSLVKERINFISHHYVLHLCRISYSYVDRLIIVPLFGFITLGNYELSIHIIVFANVFSVFVYQYLQPKDAKNESTRKLKLMAIAGSIILSLLTIFLAPVVLPILFPQFEELVDLVPIMGLSIFPHALTMIYMSKFLGSENARPIMISSLIHLLILIGGIFILTNYYSTVGIAISFVVAEIVETVLLIGMHKKTFKSFV